MIIVNRQLILDSLATVYLKLFINRSLNESCDYFVKPSIKNNEKFRDFVKRGITLITLKAKDFIKYLR